jgi:hypothetical protein
LRLLRQENDVPWFESRFFNWFVYSISTVLSLSQYTAL